MAKKTATPKAGRAGGKENGRTDVDALLASHPALKNTVAQIEKQFGEGAIMALGANHVCQITGIPTGSLSLDLALGGQGLPHGRIAEVFGPESSGKTTLALHIIAQ